jgi:hypothetical protein
VEEPSFTWRHENCVRHELGALDVCLGAELTVSAISVDLERALPLADAGLVQF